MSYTFDLPTKIIIGEGCSGQLGGIVSGSGARRVLCVCDRGVEAAGIVAPLIETMEASGLKVERFNGVLPDPPLDMIEECTKRAVDMKPDAFVAIGGGSSIDTAKAVNANLTNPGTLKEHAILLNGLKVLFAPVISD